MRRWLTRPQFPPTPSFDFGDVDVDLEGLSEDDMKAWTLNYIDAQAIPPARRTGRKQKGGSMNDRRDERARISAWNGNDRAGALPPEKHGRRQSIAISLPNKPRPRRLPIVRFRTVSVGNITLWPMNPERMDQTARRGSMPMNGTSISRSRPLTIAWSPASCRRGDPGHGQRGTTSPVGGPSRPWFRRVPTRGLARGQRARHGCAGLSAKRA